MSDYIKKKNRNGSYLISARKFNKQHEHEVVSFELDVTKPPSDSIKFYLTYKPLEKG